jgi:hypothetical protein
MVWFDFSTSRFHLASVTASERKASILRCPRRVDFGNGLSILLAGRMMMVVVVVPRLRLSSRHRYASRLKIVSY